MAADPATPENLPQRIGRYEVVGHVAAGGMGEVLLAKLVGPAGFERPVVIKRILPHLARSKQFVDMFLDEARIVAGIRHPNVVGVHELGHEGGELFLVLEYLEGESSAGLMRRMAARNEQLDFAVAAHIVAEASAGLHAAHEMTNADGINQNLVHRDVTPQNVFLTYDGAVKLLDFGIATSADRVTRTETGMVKGKIEYLSPEQCNGRILDRRSDIFALGVVLYELSTGFRLFRRSSQLLAMKAITEDAIRPPSALRTGYPPALERVCVTCLHRERSERYQTAAQLRRALLDVIHDLPRAGGLPPDEALARLMSTHFRERIDEKRELLHKVREGTRITEVPKADTDESVEIPVAVEESTVTTTGMETPSRKRSGSHRVALFALAGALIAGTGATVAWRLRHTASPSQAALPAPVASVAPTSTEVQLAVDTVPPAASVVVDGHPPCVTPCSVTLSRSTTAIDVEVSKDGYLTQHSSVVPNVEQHVLLTLPPAPHVLPSAQPRPRSTTTHATPPPSASVQFRRFD